MKLKKILLTTALGASMVLSPYATATAHKEDTKITRPGESGGAILTGSIGDASTLLPPLPTDGASHEITGMVYSGLVKYDKNASEVVGVLAKDWDISDDSKTITFYLHENVRWHDGEEFTAEDVKFTYDILVNPETPTAYGGDFQLVESAEIIDKYTIQFKYKQTFAQALASWSTSMIPEHLLKDYKPEDLPKSPLTRHPIGTGPFKFKEWTPGQSIILEANEDYFEGRPNIDTYIYRIIPDSATMFLELKSGGLDQMGLTPMQFERQTNDKKFTDKFNKFNYPSLTGYTYMGFNMNSEKFKDKKVRQAFAFATDKEKIVKGVLLGNGRAATGPYVPDDRLWYYNKNIKTYDFDQDREFLKETITNLVTQDEYTVAKNIKLLEEKYGMTFDYLYPTAKETNVWKRTLKNILSMFSLSATMPNQIYGAQNSIEELIYDAAGFEKSGDGYIKKNNYKLDNETFSNSLAEIEREIERQKARYLLAEAGWKDTDQDGLLDKDGKPFIFELVTNQGNQQRELSAVIMQQELQQIGVKQDVRVVEWSSFINEFINKKRFEAVMLGWGLGTDPDQYDIWHSTQADKPGALNFVSFKDERVDELLEKGRTTLSKEERKPYYDEFQEILAEEQPYVFLYVTDAMIAVDQRFQEIEPALTGIGHNFNDWWVPKEKQKHNLRK